MSLTAALNTAVAGLTTIQSHTSIVSANIANAQNADYTRKIVNLTTPAAGGQPQAALIASIVRAAAPELQRDIYNAAASHQQLARAVDNARTLAEALDATNATGGQATLQSLLTNFENAWKQLEATPEDTALKALVVQRGQELTAELHRLAGLRSNLEHNAQQRLQSDVATLNEAARNVEALNAKIISQKAAGMPTGDLEDLRDAEAAKIAGLVGIRTMVDDTGRMSIYTDTGTQIVGVSAQRFSYDPASGRISTAGGLDVTAGFRTGSIRAELNYLDGSAAALTSSDANRGTLAKFFNQIDSLAVNVANVVNAAYDDPDTAEAEQFFTFDPANPSGSIVVNAALAAAPANLDAARAGAVQQAMRNTTLTAAEINPAGDPNGLHISNVNIFGLTSGILSYHSRITRENEDNRDTAESLRYALDQKYRNLTGVNVDNELADLQVLQSNYAALAQVMSAITEMFDQMINIGR